MIDRKKMTSLLVNVISVKMLLTFPKIMIENSGNAAWIECIYCTVLVYILLFITFKLYRSNLNIIQFAEKINKKWLKIFVGVLIFSTLIVNYSSIIRIFPETVKIVLLQDFKIEMILPVLLIAIGIGAYIGIESIAVINSMFMMFGGAILLLSVILLIPYLNIKSILPLFGNGFYSITARGLNSISLFSDVLLLNILLPYCKEPFECKKSAKKAVIISGIVSTVILLEYCLIYPYPTSSEFMIPVYQLSRVIRIGNFFSRFEVIFQFVWSIIILLYLSIYVYTICYVWQITFNLKYYKPLILPVVVLSGIISMMPSSVVDTIVFKKTESIFVSAVAFLLPIIFGIYERKIYKNKSEDKNE